VLCFPNWAEDFYRPLEVESGAAERAEMPEGFRVVFAGNLGAAQSLETIVEAAVLLRERRDIHWVILGDGRRRSWLAEEVRARDLSATVHLLGARPASAMPRYLALGDALLATLRREPIFELTVPTKLQSYLACGRPVLAALDGEGARIVAAAGAGLTCAAQDAEALAAAVVRLHDMPAAEREAMGARGRAYYESHFDRALLLGRLEDTLQRTIEEWACAS
jgi:colanic acid biosynthesis glycosyl transferase WcaI